ATGLSLNAARSTRPSARCLHTGSAALTGSSLARLPQWSDRPPHRLHRLSHQLLGSLVVERPEIVFLLLLIDLDRRLVALALHAADARLSDGGRLCRLARLRRLSARHEHEIVVQAGICGV